MATAVQKIKLSPSRDIPFNKLVLSQSNVRRVKAGISVEELAELMVGRRVLLRVEKGEAKPADGHGHSQQPGAHAKAAVQKAGAKRIAGHALGPVDDRHAAIQMTANDAAMGQLAVGDADGADHDAFPCNGLCGCLHVRNNDSLCR